MRKRAAVGGAYAEMRERRSVGFALLKSKSKVQACSKPTSGRVCTERTRHMKMTQLNMSG